RFVASGQVSASPAVAGNLIAWGSDQGIVNVAKSQPPRLKFRMHTAPIATELVFRSAEELIVADRHGYVQLFDIARGTTRWQTSTGEQIRRAPVSIGNQVFVATQRGGLFCLDAEKGHEKWTSSSIAAISAVSGEHIYALDHFGAIRQLRADNGQVVVAGDRRDGNVVVTNSVTDRIYLADATGHVVCLREANQTWPRFHAPITGIASAPSGSDATTKDSAATPVLTPAESPPLDSSGDPETSNADTTLDPADAQPSSEGDDPFNQGAGDDPFATP
ncbi:MAG: PQQ-binding-like beta-propeller repeat protein, partial [Planctomycetota bacterium]|nr:PQQ-binding-like beta-propeller repeat protein [Planctomycetota bacterium]